MMWYLEKVDFFFTKGGQGHAINIVLKGAMQNYVSIVV